MKMGRERAVDETDLLPLKKRKHYPGFDTEALGKMDRRNSY